jgi:hypothetical protein
LTLAACVVTPAFAEASAPALQNGVGAVAWPSPGTTARVDTSTRYFITFDTGTSPCGFAATKPLRDEYAGLGVHFYGPTASSGGAVLNQCANFGVSARTGEEFLAFNTATYAVTPERIRFDALQKSVQIYVANGRGAGQSTFTLVGWRGRNIVARTSTTTTVTGWLLIRIAAAAGMDKVVLKAKTPDGAFVADDLQYTTIS